MKVGTALEEKLVRFTGGGASSGGTVSVSDIPYDATTWDNNLDAPTKNAVRDKFESLTSGGLTQPQIMARSLGC
jgi:hypothetical protein